MSNSDDNYKRTRAPAALGDLVPDVKNADPPLLGYPPEWWEQRDREVAAMRARDAEQLEHARVIERSGELRDNGFPSMHIDAALGELADTQAMRHAQLFVRLAQAGLHKRIIILGGGVGVGKTTAATWIALKGQDPRPGFIRINELERRGRYDKNLDAWLKDKTSLVIDDVGAESLDGKGVFRSLLDEIIDMFYANRRTLVMTTNLQPCRKGENEPDQFFERYGERAWTRIEQLGEWGPCGMQNLRQDRS